MTDHHLPRFLPSARLTSRWVRVSEFPTHNRFGRYSVIIDRCYKDGKPDSIRVAYVRDHRFLRETLAHLPHVPRAVRSIYQGSVRLGFAMATEVWPVLRAMNKAEEAWEAYLRNSK